MTEPNTCRTCQYLGYSCCEFDGHQTAPELSCKHWKAKPIEYVHLLLAFGEPEGVYRSKENALMALRVFEFKHRPEAWVQLQKDHTFQLVTVPIKG